MVTGKLSSVLWHRKITHRSKKIYSDIFESIVIHGSETLGDEETHEGATQLTLIYGEGFVGHPGSSTLEMKISGFALV